MKSKLIFAAVLSALTLIALALAGAVSSCGDCAPPLVPISFSSQSLSRLSERGQHESGKVVRQRLEELYGK